ncbi:hypothetical protein B5G28_11640 [Faecalibacterium sp. An77]|uniref:DUF4376 domain-containing protein n=1 Tax=Faecalibacterium sp. An77 TaxID=1965655 RepID=UPI000B365EC0|nr:hypothetical protein [Faecalibacterium sp. An77]OUN36748.1 hypothetical protein B5G28_11640 [Faecalibacterium sp. An77]
MYILSKTKSDAGQYPALESWPGLTAPDGFYWWPDSLDQTQFDQYQGFVTLEVARGTVVSCTPNQPAFEAWQAAQLAARKAERIAESNSLLDAYLLAHPLQWTDGNYYTITKTKQQQLTSKLFSATMAAQLGQPYDLKWNTTAEKCIPWTLENLTALAFAIDKRVTGLVSYQQDQETAMREATTLEELEAILVDYDSVPLPGGETA